MFKKVLLKDNIIFIPVIACFLVNIFVGNGINVSFLNSLLLGLSLIFAHFTQKRSDRVTLIFILSLSFIPLFYYYQTQSIVYIFLLLSLLFLFLIKKLARYKYVFIMLSLLTYLTAALISNGIITDSFRLDKEKLIWNVSETNQSIINHQKDARYVPYRLRLIIYNKTVYIYSALTSIACIFSLRNISDTLLFANIYPLILGIQSIFKGKNDIKSKFILGVLLLTLLATGISRSPEKYSSLFIAAPIFVYLITLGFQRTNKRVYLILFVFSLILVTSPV